MSLETTGNGRLLRIALLAAALTLASVPGAMAAADPPLVEAAKKWDRAAIRALLQQGADVNAVGGDGSPALHWLIGVDDFETVKLLVDAGADATMANPQGATPLFLAAALGNADMVELFLNAGADPNAVDEAGETTLMLAVRSRSPQAVRALLDRGAAVDAREPQYQQTALMLAARESHPDVVRLLVERGADVNAQTRQGATPRMVLPNSEAGFGHGVGIVRGGSPEQGRRDPVPGALTPLHYAARDGRLEAVRILVAAGADIEKTDGNDLTPLLMAIASGRAEVARFLVEQGANVNAVDWYGRTPLFAAVEMRNTDVHNSTFEHGVDRESMLRLAEFLFERGADPNSRTREAFPIRLFILPTTRSLSWVDFTGQTPLIAAALAGDVRVMRLLLERGADPHITTFGGTTVLMAAAGINWTVFQTYDEGPEALLEAVKLAYELGIDVNAVNSMGLTAVHGAANRGSNDIIEFLVEHGARLDIQDKEGRTPLTWAEGVFLATHPSQPKPGSIALIQRLMAAGNGVGPAGGGTQE